jgi:hypothetical protein
MSVHKVIHASAHDHDYSVTDVLSKLGIDRGDVPRKWAGSFDQLANLLNVSDNDLHRAFACTECQQNNRSGGWRDKISWGADNGEPVGPANELNRNPLRGRKLANSQKKRSEFMTDDGTPKGYGHWGIAEKLEERGYELPEGFRGNSDQLAATMGIDHKLLARLWRKSEDELRQLPPIRLSPKPKD